MNSTILTIVVSAIITLVLFLVIHRINGARRAWLGILMILLPAVDGLIRSASTVWLIAGILLVITGILIVALDRKMEKEKI